MFFYIIMSEPVFTYLPTNNKYQVTQSINARTDGKNLLIFLSPLEMMSLTENGISFFQKEMI